MWDENWVIICWFMPKTAWPTKFFQCVTPFGVPCPPPTAPKVQVLGPPLFGPLNPWLAMPLGKIAWLILCRWSSRCSPDDGREVSTRVRRMYIGRLHPGAGTHRLLRACCQWRQRPALLLVILITTHVTSINSLIPTWCYFSRHCRDVYMCVLINCLLMYYSCTCIFVYNRQFNRVFLML